MPKIKGDREQTSITTVSSAMHAVCAMYPSTAFVKWCFIAKMEFPGLDAEAFWHSERGARIRESAKTVKQDILKGRVTRYQACVENGNKSARQRKHKPHHRGSYTKKSDAAPNNAPPEVAATQETE